MRRRKCCFDAVGRWGSGRGCQLDMERAVYFWFRAQSGADGTCRRHHCETRPLRQSAATALHPGSSTPLEFALRRARRRQHGLMPHPLRPVASAPHPPPPSPLQRRASDDLWPHLLPVAAILLRRQAGRVQNSNQGQRFVQQTGSKTYELPQHSRSAAGWLPTSSKSTSVPRPGTKAAAATGAAAGVAPHAAAALAPATFRLVPRPRPSPPPPRPPAASATP